MGRPPEHLGNRADLHDAPGIDHGHAVAGLRHDDEIVRDEHDAHAELAAQAQQQLQDLVLDGDVERRRRLVGEEKLGTRPQARSRS